MKVFRTVKGDVVDVVKHTLDVLKKHPNASIRVGTDSQNTGSVTSYSTVIAYRYGTRGVHYIASKKRVPRINDLWTRLWKEAEDSVEVAEWLTEKINTKVVIDMDYNDDDTHNSNKLISAAKGWANSLGYTVYVKPDELIATRAADYYCR